jgi:hypothetical protein
VPPALGAGETQRGAAMGGRKSGRLYCREEREYNVEIPESELRKRARVLLLRTVILRSNSVFLIGKKLTGRARNGKFDAPFFSLFWRIPHDRSNR